jgi:hypothetical protein
VGDGGGGDQDDEWKRGSIHGFVSPGQVDMSIGACRDKTIVASRRA